MKNSYLTWITVTGSMYCLLSGCISDDSTSSDGIQLNIQTPLQIRQIQAIDPSQLTISVTINGNTPILARRSSGRWVLPRLKRADYQPSNSIYITWTEEFSGQPVLLAEYSGTFSLPAEGSENKFVDPRGDFIPDEESRFDIDQDGVSNLAERSALPPSNPLLQSSFPTPGVVNIPGGCFNMGSPDSEDGRSRNEGPVFSVCVDTFKLSQYEVTFAQYDAFSNNTGRSLVTNRSWGRGNRPIANITYQDVFDYLDWLSTETGQRYRLPTEAEWEYAARAGTTTPFHTGFTITSAQANFNSERGYNGTLPSTPFEQTIPVGSLASNAFGLYDMHGNVAEMTCSRFKDPYDGSEQLCSTRLLSTEMSVRGGSWLSSPGFIRSAKRASKSTSDSANSYNGFRVVQE